MEFRPDARPSPIAGTWYTGEPHALSAQVDAYLAQAKINHAEIGGKVIGIVSPHAGHRYSGKTAGYAYRTVQQDARALAVILSPLHHYYAGDFVTTAHSAYRTPLGDVPTAVDNLQKLEGFLADAGLELIQVSADEEHSLEIQLPFLQRAWETEFRLLPVMVRCHDAETLQTFARALFESIQDDNFLLVASTDLSHFYPQETAEQLDAEMLRRIQSFDPQGVLNAESEGRASACGAVAVAACLWTAKLAGADRVQILHYSTSANSTGDTSSVVGYGAAAIIAAE